MSPNNITSALVTTTEPVSNTTDTEIESSATDDEDTTPEAAGNITLTTFYVGNESVAIYGQNTTSETVSNTIATTFDAGNESVTTKSLNITWLNITANTILNLTSMSTTQTTLVSPSSAQSTSSTVTALDRISTAPQPTVQCLRGVLSDTGVCLCPDEWTGETCNISKIISQ